MSTRPILEQKHVSENASAAMSKFHASVLDEVRTAVEKNAVVVVGMAQNPHVKGVRKTLDEASVQYMYLEYGSYFSEWKKRLAIKMWSGWPTFPQVFVKGELIGGHDLTKAALADGSFKKKIGD